MQSALVAVDTNFLLDLALPRDVVHDALDVIRQRIPGANIVILPTVLDELDHLCYEAPHAATRRLARHALENMVRTWKFQPKVLTDVGRDIIESIGDKIRSRGIVPEAERNDSYLIAEAALAGCDFLVSSDRHLRDADRTKLSITLKGCDVGVVVVCTPLEIVTRFGGK
jgi:predicted nucleic acid-binding protein